MYKRYQAIFIPFRPIVGLILLLVQILLFASVAVAAPFAQAEQITASVVVSALNVRSGPGTNFSRSGLVKSGEILTVIGQVQNCAWLQIQTTQSVEGWVAGSSRYVTLSRSCAEIPASTTDSDTESKQPNTPADTSTPVATPTAIPATSSERPSWLAPGAELGMAAELEQKVPLKSDLACLLFQNFIGRQVYITLTQQDGPHIEEIPLERYSEKALCLPGGKYSVTITSANLGSTGGQIKFYNGTRDEFRIFLRH